MIFGLNTDPEFGDWNLKLEGVFAWNGYCQDLAGKWCHMSITSFLYFIFYICHTLNLNPCPYILLGSRICSRSIRSLNFGTSLVSDLGLQPLLKSSNVIELSKRYKLHSRLFTFSPMNRSNQLTTLIYLISVHHNNSQFHTLYCFNIIIWSGP